MFYVLFAFAIFTGAAAGSWGEPDIPTWVTAGFVLLAGCAAAVGVAPVVRRGRGRRRRTRGDG